MKANAHKKAQPRRRTYASAGTYRYILFGVNIVLLLSTVFFFEQQRASHNSITERMANYHLMSVGWASEMRANMNILENAILAHDLKIEASGTESEIAQFLEIDSEARLSLYLARAELDKIVKTQDKFQGPEFVQMVQRTKQQLFDIENIISGGLSQSLEAKNALVQIEELALSLERLRRLHSSEHADLVESLPLLYRNSFISLIGIILVLIFVSYFVTRQILKFIDRANEALKEREERFRNVVESMPVAMVVVGADGRIVMLNEEAEKVFGYNRNELIEELIEILIPKRYHGHHPSLRGEFFASRQSRQMGIGRDLFGHHKNGSEFPIEVALRSIELNGQNMVLSAIVDISDREQAEKALGTANKLFKVAFENANIAICLVDLSGHFTTVNKQATEMYGYSYEELKKLTFRDITHPDDLQIGLEYLQQAIEGKIDDFRVIKRYIHKNGHTIWAELSNSIIRDNEGNPLHFIAYLLDITERKKAEDHLRHYQRIVSSSHDMLALLDNNFAYLAVNDSYANAFGKKRHELIGNTPSEAFGDEFFRTVIGPHADKCLQGEEVHYESWFDFPAIGKRYMEISYLPYRNSDNEIKGFVVNGRDITDRKLAEEALQESEEKFEKAFNFNPASITISRFADGLILEVNTGFERISGYSRQEAIGKTTIELGLFKDPAVREEIKNILQKESRIRDFEFAGYNKSGESRTLSFSAELMEMRDETYLLTTIIDITERKLAEEAQRESEQGMRLLLESAFDGIVISVKGEILEANQAFATMFGCDINEAIGLNAYEITTPESAKLIVDNIAAGFEEPYEIVGIKKDGTHIDIEVVGRNCTYRGQAARITAMRDITERKEAEEERTNLEVRLRQQQRLESLGTLAGGVAHEINNPINGIMNYAQLINDRLDPENPLREYAGEIVRESERVAKIVLNLLTFARQDKEPHSHANISDNVNATLSLVRTIIRGNQIKLDVNVPEDLPKIKCRSQQIQQVLMNLLTNARDALNLRYSGHDPNKIIKVTAKLFEKEGRKWIRTTVEDHGSGISEAIGDRVFDPFFTTKDRTKGTGLGLSISHGIVKDHHGELSYESEVGKYTRFHLDLPVDNGWTLEEKQKGIE